MTKIKKFITDSIADFKKVPSWLIAVSSVAVVLMNLVANKGLLNLSWIALDAGFLVSWVMFLCMDIATQKYGGKASFAVTVFNVGVALASSLLLLIIAKLPPEWGGGWFFGAQSEGALNTVIGNSILVVLVSLLAYVVASGIDILSNITIGKWMRNSKAFKNEDGKRTVKGFFVYFTRAYTSTFLSQFVDNLVFQFIAYNFLFSWFYGGVPGAALGSVEAQLSILMGAFTGAVAELLLELLFAPIGYLAIAEKDNQNIKSSSKITLWARLVKTSILVITVVGLTIGMWGYITAIDKTVDARYTDTVLKYFNSGDKVTFDLDDDIADIKDKIKKSSVPIVIDKEEPTEVKFENQFQDEDKFYKIIVTGTAFSEEEDDIYYFIVEQFDLICYDRNEENNSYRVIVDIRDNDLKEDYNNYEFILDLLTPEQVRRAVEEAKAKARP